MFCEWSGSTTKVYHDSRQLQRIISTPKPVQCAQVTGDGNSAHIAITMIDGHTRLYDGTGRLIRA